MAQNYDAFFGRGFEDLPLILNLTEGASSIIEFAVGTGRIAIPLADEFFEGYVKMEPRPGGVTAIRLAVPADSASITEVMEASREAGIPYLPKLYTREQIHSWIETTVLANSTVWIAEVGNRIVGFLALNGVELDHLYVHPDYWSNGFGSLL
jgi:hypothetical protein